MQPDTAPFTPRLPTTCSDCDRPLEPGQRWRCRPCVDAAHLAAERAAGAVVRPSDVAAQREGE